MCLQRRFGSAYFWSHEWVDYISLLALAFLLCWNLTWVSGIVGTGPISILQRERKGNCNWVFSFQFLCSSPCGRLYFTKKGATMSSVGHGPPQRGSATLSYVQTGSTCWMSPPLESGGLSFLLTQWNPSAGACPIMWEAWLPWGSIMWGIPGDMVKPNAVAEGRGLQVTIASCHPVTPPVLGF